MDNLSGDHMPKPSESVRDTVSQDGAVLLDIEQGLCFSLNPVAAKIWEMLKQRLPSEAIIEALEKEFRGVSRLQIEADVKEFVDDLQKRRLLYAREERKRTRSGLLSLLARRKLG